MDQSCLPLNKFLLTSHQHQPLEVGSKFELISEFSSTFSFVSRENSKRLISTFLEYALHGWIIHLHIFILSWVPSSSST